MTEDFRPKVWNVPDDYFSKDIYKNLTVAELNTGPTGTHKDWYAQKLLKKITTDEKFLGNNTEFCAITSGSFGTAVQHQLNEHNLPPLIAITDEWRTPYTEKQRMKNLGARIIELDLSEKLLTEKDIIKVARGYQSMIEAVIKSVLPMEQKSITDLTSFSQIIDFEPYDDLARDILENQEEFELIYVPYGTGELANAIAVECEKRKWKTKIHGVTDLKYTKGINCFRSPNPFSLYPKLTSPYAPFATNKNKNLKIEQVNEEWAESGIFDAEKLNIIAENSATAGMTNYSYHYMNGYSTFKKSLVVFTGKCKMPSTF